jgi:hypothetical protein
MPGAIAGLTNCQSRAKATCLYVWMNLKTLLNESKIKPAPGSPTISLSCAHDLLFLRLLNLSKMLILLFINLGS